MMVMMAKEEVVERKKMRMMTMKSSELLHEVVGAPVHGFVKQRRDLW
jgi:hypothetical protein